MPKSRCFATSTLTAARSEGAHRPTAVACSVLVGEQPQRPQQFDALCFGQGCEEIVENAGCHVVPVFERGTGDAEGDTFASAKNVAKGAYVLAEAPGGTPDVILVATGSEVQIAVEAREVLKAEGINARVVSAPSLEWFEEQTAEYRESVLPAGVTARVSIEAGISLTWDKYVGDAGRSVSIEHFGASADYKTLFREFGMTTEAAVAAAKDSLAAL